MTGANRYARTARVAALGFALLVPLAVRAAAAPADTRLADDLLDDWYYTEVVVFVRPDVHDYATVERLTGPAAPLHSALRTFQATPEARWDARRLSPVTRAQLAFPYLDASRLDLFAPGPANRPDRSDGFAGAARAPAGEPFGEPFGEPSGEAIGGAAGGRPPPDIVPRLQPDPLLDFLRDLAAFEAGLERDSYRPLEPQTFALASHARAVTGRAGYRLLLHRRWLQRVPARDAPQPLYVQIGPRDGDAYTLEGTFDVTRGRYLHVGAHLLYREPLLGRAPIDQALPPPGLNAVGGAASRRLSPDDLQPAGFLQLRENRRMNPERVSYFDHPKLGVLVRVEPVVPPAGLSAAYRGLLDDG